jgi:8-oxo-dGTP pyrophosphatase MutT (NUDIX family)
MHRAPVLRLLDAYLVRHPEERVAVDHVRQFVRANADCFERSCRDGHVTGSAWIVSADHRRVLLTHHRKLGRWLQLGGHADGDPDPLRVALREAEEESGLHGFTVREPLPLDVDVHVIPTHGDEPPHLHHDLRYLLVAADGEPLRASEESHALRWVERERLGELVSEESLLRLERKTRALLG